MRRIALLTTVALLLALLAASGARADEIEVRDARCPGDRGRAGARRRFRLRAHAAARRRGGQRRAAVLPRRVRADPRRRWYWFDETTACGGCRFGCPIMRCPGNTGWRRDCCSRTSLRWRKRSRSDAGCNWLVVERSVPARERTTRRRAHAPRRQTLLPKPFQMNALTDASCTSSRRGAASPCAACEAPAPVESRALPHGCVTWCSSSAAWWRRWACSCSRPRAATRRSPSNTRCCSRSTPRSRRCSPARRLPARRHGAALSRARVRHPPDAAPAALRRARGAARAHRLRGFGAVPHRSIESWFDVQVDAALEGGINLAQQAIDQMKRATSQGRSSRARARPTRSGRTASAAARAPARAGGRAGSDAVHARAARGSASEAARACRRSRRRRGALRQARDARGIPRSKRSPERAPVSCAWSRRSDVASARSRRRARCSCATRAREHRARCRACRRATATIRRSRSRARPEAHLRHHAYASPCCLRCFRRSRRRSCSRSGSPRRSACSRRHARGGAGRLHRAGAGDQP